MGSETGGNWCWSLGTAEAVNTVYMCSLAVIVVAIVQLSSVPLVQCQAFPDHDPAFVDRFTRSVYSQISNLTMLLITSNLAKSYSFCIKDPQTEWDRAFNFSSNLTFVSNCIRTKGDITRRMCTAKEINMYFTSFGLSGSPSSIEPNKNCNMTSWVSGCEPGWGCRANMDGPADLRNFLDEPDRTQDCQSCCEGFFCPRGITCMIPCPLGSYCPLATVNTSTGRCEPYFYELPPGQPNHTCGGANIWADVRSSGEVFCSAGSYCPTSTERDNCSKGYYCPKGSTAEKRCIKLTTCDASTSSQNIHACGVMLIAALSTILLIIYSCSDQVMTTRERRLAKTREAAARSVREKAQARVRWKSAKEAAKKHAIELQSQGYQKYSCRKIATENDKVKKLNQAELGPDCNLYPPEQPAASSESEHSTASSITKKAKATNLIRMVHEIEDYTESYGNFSFETENKNTNNKITKEKEIHTDSQIFKYAYGQLEKEKVLQQQNKNISFSGVISMATNTKIRKRPVIEIVFRDLTVTLKGKNKHLLRSVTGKIMPGRITAVMGPSGAGKTTFLSALAGKAVGCTMSGLILINGKTESINSYKKIVGFVPQDDIVHGNLTVEENLWFSARCRLSADLPKPDRVLIVERVIESLGLQLVRNSLVGTVEKRGISGGQRKRVNVGLELVMQPSVLFLDEPTSGLDSSSSQLLLRALRREALEGVNICMVVHQPSYILFKMFDDLILLAKGGLTVYHGSVRKVEEYFAGLGIYVPERVNPPDYYIDVLEGMARCTSSNVSYEEFPVRWMLHNGYHVPPDMRHHSALLTTMPVDTNSGNHEISTELNEDQSFAGEMWQDVKCNMERHRDILQHNFLRSKDLSNRRTPSVLLQYKYFLGRVGRQRMREARMQAIDYLILLVSGACLGSISKSSDEQFGAPGYVHTIISVSLLCKITALRSFSLDKLQYWRESSSGISSLAYFVSKDTIDHFNTVIKPVIYLSTFYFFNNPRSSFADNYIVLLCLVYCVTGIAYALAIFLAPGPSQLLSVLLPVVLTLVATQAKDNNTLRFLAKLCYPKWALQAFVIANAERYYGVWIITRCAMLFKSGYNLHDWNLCIAIIILIGLGSRIIAFLGMLALQRK